jgi:Gluconate 2-dehydrogenase subunit 3
MTSTKGLTHNRFPGFDVVSQRHTWDPQTERVVLSRVGPQPAIKFFDASEQPTARALVKLLLALEEDSDVPALELIDQRLLRGTGDGFRFWDMPSDGEAWKKSIAALDAEAQSRWHRPFAELGQEQQTQIVGMVRQTSGEWQGLPAGHMFSVWMRHACRAFYSHPTAWNEIGFGGPAYPRGYKNLGVDRREGWEVADHRPVDPVGWATQVEDARAAAARSLVPSDKPTGAERSAELDRPENPGADGPSAAKGGTGS